MIIRLATREQIEAAMRAVNAEHATTLYPGCSAYGNSGIEPVGKGWRLTLKLQSSRDPFHRHGQSRPSLRLSNDGCGKRMTYVCWHGHRAFMRALYQLAPAAVIRSSLAVYKGRDDFERTHETTAWGRDPQRGIGSMFSPLAYSDACDCEREECPSRQPGRVARVDSDAMLPSAFESPTIRVGYADPELVTPEQTLADAGIDGDRWSDYNRKFNDLLMRKSP